MDARRAHFHSPTDADLYVDPPPQRQKKCMVGSSRRACTEPGEQQLVWRSCIDESCVQNWDVSKAYQVH
eukprot:6235168-Prorocentrum_lima.AAC.1